MKKISLLGIAVTVLISLASCDEAPKIPAEWTNAVNKISGYYRVTTMNIVDEKAELDLNGDGESHNDLLLELSGLGNFNFCESIPSTVNPADYFFGKNSIATIWLPTQKIILEHGEVSKIRIEATAPAIEVNYSVNDSYEIITGDVKILDDGDSSEPYMEMSDIHLSFPEKNKMQVEATITLYDQKTETLGKYPVIYTFTRYKLYL